MQMGWNRDCLIAGPVIYFSSPTVLTVGASNKNTDCISSSHQWFVHPSRSWVVARRLTLYTDNALFAIKLCFSPSSFQADIYSLNSSSSFPVEQTQYISVKTARFSLIMRGWLVDAFINFVILCLIVLRSTDGFLNCIVLSTACTRIHVNDPIKRSHLYTGPCVCCFGLAFLAS